MLHTSVGEVALTLVLMDTYITVGTRDIETTIFDPTSEFLNFMCIVYLLYCSFTVSICQFLFPEYILYPDDFYGPRNEVVSDKIHQYLTTLTVTVMGTIGTGTDP
jgi:hypothetical protein